MADPVRDIRDRGHAIRFGIVTPQMWRSWEEMLDLWRRTERAGFDLAFLIDHFQSDWDGDEGPMLEAWTLLAALARDVPRIDIGTFVSGITHRPPVVLAKQAVTLDHVSGGRAILGLGAAWNEREHDAYGIPFPPIGERVDRVEEALAAIDRLEHEPRVSIGGRFLRIVDAPFEPKPVRGHVPILIGSTKPRMLRIAARYADYVDFPGRPDRVREVGRRLSADAAAAGRDPDAIRWVVELQPSGSPIEEFDDLVDALAPLGVSVFLLNVWPRSDPSVVDRLGEQLDDLRRRWS
ncbi:MAG TPA: LLM class flavin-dependent oxidoreductase [Candidatus Limnocylindrales bacterium]|nr:LLM class flavin-dependent oxidoreductase [Candidatus Limnocylindrales bacterium]